jgi:hypothetical protein
MAIYSRSIFIQDGNTEIGTGHRTDGLAALEGLHAFMVDERNGMEWTGCMIQGRFDHGVYRHQSTHFLQHRTFLEYQSSSSLPIFSL